MPLTLVWGDILHGPSRRLALLGLAALVAAAAGLLWYAGGHPNLRPPAIACVAVAVLGSKAPLMMLQSRLVVIYRLALYCMGVVATWAAIFLPMMSFHIVSALGAANVLVVGGGFLLLGPAISVIELAIDRPGNGLR